MNPLLQAGVNWGREVARAWDRFWFTPQQPHTLALIRIFGGAMLLYTHLVWTLDLEAFFGPKQLADGGNRRAHESRSGRQELCVELLVLG